MSLDRRKILVAALVLVCVAIPLVLAITKIDDGDGWAYLIVGLPVLGLAAGLASLVRTAARTGRGRRPMDADPPEVDRDLG